MMFSQPPSLTHISDEILGPAALGPKTREGCFLDHVTSTWKLGPDFTYSPAQWSADTKLSDDVQFPRAHTQSDKAWISTEVSAGNIFLRINGTTGSESYQFRVNISPPPPGLPEGQITLNQYMAWTSLEGPAFVTVLDPKERYTVTVTNIADGNRKWLLIKSFETWYVGNLTDGAGQVDGDKGDGISGPKEKKNMTAVIVGCAVSVENARDIQNLILTNKQIAGVVIGILVALGFFYFGKWHRKRMCEGKLDRLPGSLTASVFRVGRHISMSKMLTMLNPTRLKSIVSRTGHSTRKERSRRVIYSKKERKYQEITDRCNSTPACSSPGPQFSVPQSSNANQQQLQRHRS
jgi:hypothetical protein